MLPHTNNDVKKTIKNALKKFLILQGTHTIAHIIASTQNFAVGQNKISGVLKTNRHEYIEPNSDATSFLKTFENFVPKAIVRIM